MKRLHRLARLNAENGFSLVLVLVLLSALALGSAASMRGSANASRVSQAALMQAYAHEQAQLALSYCQSQLLLPPAERNFQLAEVSLTPADRPAWLSASLWRNETSVVTVLAAQLEGANRAPVCFVERQTLAEQPEGLPVYIVTARGFSPDYRADALSGLSVTGTSVWLQRVLLIDDARVSAQTDRRILNPPLR